MRLPGLSQGDYLNHNIGYDDGFGITTRDGSTGKIVATTAGFSLTGMLSFIGSASFRGLRTSSATAVAITAATTIVLRDSGGVFSVTQGAGAIYDIDLPSPTTGPGCRYLFYLGAQGANNVTITVAGAALFVGTIVNDVTSVVPANGSTLTFVTGASAVGDTIEIISISTTLYLVRAVSSAVGGITIA